MKIFLFICFHFWNFLSHDVIKVHIVCVLKKTRCLALFLIAESFCNRLPSKKERLRNPKKRKKGSVTYHFSYRSGSIHRETWVLQFIKSFLKTMWFVLFSEKGMKLQEACKCDCRLLLFMTKTAAMPGDAFKCSSARSSLAQHCLLLNILPV